MHLHSQCDMVDNRERKKGRGHCDKYGTVTVSALPLSHFFSPSFHFVAILVTHWDPWKGRRWDFCHRLWHNFFHWLLYKQRSPYCLSVNEKLALQIGKRGHITQQESYPCPIVVYTLTSKRWTLHPSIYMGTWVTIFSLLLLLPFGKAGGRKPGGGHVKVRHTRKPSYGIYYTYPFLCL